MTTKDGRVAACKSVSAGTLCAAANTHNANVVMYGNGRSTNGPTPFFYHGFTVSNICVSH